MAGPWGAFAGATGGVLLRSAGDAVASEGFQRLAHATLNGAQSLGGEALRANLRHAGLTVLELAGGIAACKSLSKAGRVGRGSGHTGEYRHVKGHHVHAKKAFEGHVNYDPKKGFSISNQMMESLGISHNDITGYQKRLFTELSRSGRPNTIYEHSRIGVESMVSAGMSREMARSLVAQSLISLRQMGVKHPTNIPWGKK